MTTEQTRVDILSLEGFRRALNARLMEAETLLKTVTGSAATHPPLGTFVDATRVTGDHGSRHHEQAERVRRLVAAIQAAQLATDSIIDNYRTTEARNLANSNDIANALGGVQSALGGGSSV